jgi:hypothetical protein
VTKAYVITEGPAAAAVLKKLLPEDLTGRTEFVIASSRYSLQSLARSILATRHRPVAVVIDAETYNDGKIQEEEEFLNATLRQVAVDTKSRVFIAKPDLMSVLSEDSALGKHATRHASKSAAVSEGRSKSLREINKDADMAHLGNLLDKLDTRTLTDIRKQPFFSAIAKFLGSVVGTTNHRPKVPDWQCFLHLCLFSVVIPAAQQVA